MSPDAVQNKQGLPNQTTQKTEQAELESLLCNLFYYSTQLWPEKLTPTIIRQEKNISTFLSSF